MITLQFWQLLILAAIEDDMVEEGGTTPQTPSAVERPGKRRRHLSTRFSFNIGYYTYTIIQDSPG